MSITPLPAAALPTPTGTPAGTSGSSGEPTGFAALVASLLAGATPLPVLPVPAAGPGQTPEDPEIGAGLEETEETEETEAGADLVASLLAAPPLVPAALAPVVAPVAGQGVTVAPVPTVAEVDGTTTEAAATGETSGTSSSHGADAGPAADGAEATAQPGRPRTEDQPPPAPTAGAASAPTQAAPSTEASTATSTGTSTATSTAAATVTPTVTSPSIPSTAGTPETRPVPVTAQLVPEVTRLLSRGDGLHRLTMTLQPEALGEVRVTLTIRDGEVHVRLAAGTEAQRALLEGAPELRRVLELAGASDPRVVVRDLAGQSGPTSQPTTPAPGGGGGRGDASAPGQGDGGGQHQHAGTRGGSTARDGLTDGASVPRPEPARRSPRGIDLTM